MVKHTSLLGTVVNYAIKSFITLASGRAERAGGVRGAGREGEGSREEARE